MADQASERSALLPPPPPQPLPPRVLPAPASFCQEGAEPSVTTCANGAGRGSDTECKAVKEEAGEGSSPPLPSSTVGSMKHDGSFSSSSSSSSCSNNIPMEHTYIETQRSSEEVGSSIKASESSLQVESRYEHNTNQISMANRDLLTDNSKLSGNEISLNIARNDFTATELHNKGGTETVSGAEQFEGSASIGTELSRTQKRNSSNINVTNVCIDRENQKDDVTDLELSPLIKMESTVNVMKRSSSSRGCADEDDPLNVSLDGTPSKRNKRKMTEPRRRTTDFSIRSICPDSDAEDNGNDTMNALVESQVKFTDIASMNLIVGPLAGISFVGAPLVIPGICRAVHPTTVGESRIPSHLSFGNVPIPRRSSSADSMGSAAEDFPTSFSGHSVNRSPAYHGGFQRRTDMTRVSSSSLSEDRATTRDQFRTSTSRGPSPDSQSASVYDGDSPPPNQDGGLSRRSRKNYKNMTKQRRIEANARERTRVHTISAAFESLRRAVPSYSYNQRLSKLAILRIACSYILALARLADLDYSEEQDSMAFSTCVDLCTQTIQAEGKAKRKH